jgi:hypothetical protein
MSKRIQHDRAPSTTAGGGSAGDVVVDDQLAGLPVDDRAADAADAALPPGLLRRSGIYRIVRPGPPPGPTPLPLLATEELRVDVDGFMPTMTVSGTITRLFGGRLTWLARVTGDATTGEWTGPITYRDGATALRPQSTVSVRLSRGPVPPSTPRATATFSGGPGPRVTHDYEFAQAAFRDVAFEYDTASDATAVTTYNPSSHPNHPASVPDTTLSLESAYERVGIRVTKTGGDSPIDISAAGPNATWSDQEMHDAMQAHWSRWLDAPQWAVWVLFARLHDRGSSLGGIMFDDIGTAQRQGTSIFSDSFISKAPPGEANPVEWVRRMKFWTAAHEIGHTFNLAHSWDKEVGTTWIPLTNEPSALSYMNYPFNYPAGLDAFFAAFEFGFSPDELLFLRHAPERLVQMGAEPWFQDHAFEKEAFEQLRSAVTGPWELSVRVHREARFEFLEPVVVEVRLKNVSTVAAVIDSNALNGDGLALVVAKDGGDTKRWLPFARYCSAPSPTVLQPGEALYGSVFLSAGTGGWLISDPGTYTVYAVIDTGNGSAALSRPLRLAVDRPAGATAERLAGDVFTKDVAHTIAFGGTRQLTTANTALQRVADKLPGSMAAVHANAVLGAPKALPGKVLDVDRDGRELVKVEAAAPEQARELLSKAVGDVDKAADALGHIAVTEHIGRLADTMAIDGDARARTDLLRGAADVLERRGVLPVVVEQLRRM